MRANDLIKCSKICVKKNMCEKQLIKIAATTRFLHDRTKEHLANDNSSVKKHLITHHRNNNHNIELKVITREDDPVNLRLHEAYYIRK